MLMVDACMGSAFTDYTQTLLLASPVEAFSFFFFGFGKIRMTYWIRMTTSCFC